jgi:Protein of unknown function (DUF1360)
VVTTPTDLNAAATAGFWAHFVLAALATWRVSHLVVSEDGPWEVFARVRQWLGNSTVGRLVDCFGCVSMWVAAPISLFVFRRPMELLVCWLAVSGAAFLLERHRPEPLVIEQVPETKSTGGDNGMLR